MAVKETSGFLKYKDDNGDTNLLLPITTKDNVDGIDDLENELARLGEQLTILQNTYNNLVNGLSAHRHNVTVTDTAVGANGTANAITGFGTHTTANAITELNTTTVKNPSVTNVSIPNVTGNASVTATKISHFGSLPTWSASVANGVLSFNFGAGSLPTGSDVTASNTTLGAALSASQVSTTDVTVATGPKNTANAITALGTATTASCLTGVKVTVQPTVTITDATGTSN